MKRIILAVMLILIGMVIGISPIGTRIKCLYYTIRFRGAPIVQNYVKSPCNLKIDYSLNSDKKLEIYLVNEESKEMLPILDINGSTQVGDFKHRFLGLEGEAKSKMLIEIGEMKSKVVDRLQKLLEELKE